MKDLNNYLYVGCDDKTIRVYDLDSFMCLEEFIGHDDGVISLEFSDGLLYSGSYDHSIRSWDLNEMESRISEKFNLLDEDVLSRKLEFFLKFMAKKKKKKGKKGKMGKRGKKGKKRKSILGGEKKNKKKNASTSKEKSPKKKKGNNNLKKRAESKEK